MVSADPVSGNPRVFFSYSLSKTTRPELIGNVINSLKTAVLELGWEIKDPMEPNIEGIRDKVENSLWNADAAIIEATTSSPNVMFEAGYARALSCPSLVLINKETFSDANLQAYFKFLNLHPGDPLSADLGDIEYLTYPQDSIDSESWNAFRHRSVKILQVLQELLAPEAVLAKRSAKKILLESTKFIQRHSNSHPIIGLLGGRLNMIAEGYDLYGSNVFQTDARHYCQTLGAYLTARSTQSLKVMAIADRTSGIEKFWEKQRDPFETSVVTSIAERLFLVEWRIFFQPEQWQVLHELLQAGQKYVVRLGIKNETMSDDHILGRDGIGEDLLLVEPDLVGGYVREFPWVMLKVERKMPLYREALDRYQAIKKRTFEVTSGMTVINMKRAWLELNGIGQWNLQWGETDKRDNSYFEKYDQHIRCWIPKYERLIQHCAALTEEAVLERMRQKASPMKILEIGYGTGELSEHLLSWIDNVNAPAEKLRKPKIVSSFLGIDSAERMQHMVKKRFPGERLFDVCSAPTWSKTVKDQGLYDVVCGSLVLHDIVAQQVNGGLANFLTALSPIMEDSGLVLFADVFLSDDEAEKSAQIALWKDQMTHVGLNQQEIDDFFAGNPELLDTLTIGKVDAEITQVGYKRIEFSTIPGFNDTFPFKVLILQKQLRFDT